MKLLSTILLASMALSASEYALAEDVNPVIEVVTLKVKPEVSMADFSKIDKKIEQQHVSRQPGFISRESAAGENHDWVVIVHWRSVKDADASMNSFANAPAAREFMDSIDANSMKMTRYQRP